NAYMEMVAKYDRKITAEKEGKKQPASAKQPKSKSGIEKSSKPPGKGKVAKVHNVKSSFQLVDEPDEEPTQSEHKPKPEHQGECEEYDMERAIQMSLESFQAQGHAHVGGVLIQELVAEAIRPLPVVEGKGKAIRRTPATEEASTGPSAQPHDDTSVNIVRDSPSLTDAETGAESDKTNSGGDTEILQITKELGEDVDKQVNLEEKTVELDQDQARSDPGETHESRPLPEQVFMDEDQAGLDPGESGVALAGLDPEPTHDKFMANLYPKIQESLQFSADEHVIVEDPLSLTGTLSSMKNLKDAYTIGDQFINDKSVEDELGKLNVEAEVVSMVTVPIFQASSLVSPLSTLVIDLSPPKPASSTTQAPIFTAIKMTTTTTLPPPPQQQSTTELEVFTLELRDMPHKIDETIRETVKEAVQDVESGSYKSLSEYVALYEALEASMERAQRDEFLAEKDKSRKRCRDDQDPPPPPPDSDLSKKKQHDSGASGSSQSPAPQSFAWKKSDTRDTSSSSFKQQSGHHSKQPVEDIPMPDTANISDSKDTSPSSKDQAEARIVEAYEEDRPETPEPDWIGKKKLNQVDLVNPEDHRLVLDVRQTVTWETTGHGDKGRRSALSISKLKAAQYLDFRLEELVPSLWIESELRSHMRILSVVSLKTYERYGYTFLKEIVLRRADYKEYKISKADFNNLHPNDFKDLYLLHLQSQLNHLSCTNKVHLYNAVNLWIRNIVIRKRVEDLQLGVESYQTKLNLTQPDWDASDFLFKEDYTILSKP
ncbi:hypothetical protein Tco_1350739, partial [Tanacetum coccineum]